MCLMVSIVYHVSFIFYSSLFHYHYYQYVIYHHIYHITSTIIISHPSHLMCLMVSVDYQLSFIVTYYSFPYYCHHHIKSSSHSSHSLNYNSITSLPSNVFNGPSILLDIFHYHASFISLSSLSTHHPSSH